MSADALEASLAPRFAVRYDELMSQPWVDAFYGGSGFFNTGFWTDGITSPHDACVRLMDELASRLPEKPANLLDVACGFGATTAELARRFPNTRITGINLSEAQIARCRERTSSAEFAVMDATQLEFDDATFDAIVSVEAAFHFSTRERFFAEAARVLRPGARLVLCDILYSDPSVVGGWMVPSANRITKLDTYREQLEAAGFDDIELVDATSECWVAFCRALGNFIGSNDLTQRLERCVAHYVLVFATKRRARPAIALRVRRAESGWEALAQQTIFFLVAHWRSQFAEAMHTLPFPPEQGFSDPRTFHSSDLFARALIGDAMCDGDTLLEGQLAPLIDDELDILVDQRRRTGVGGWSYFPTVIELPPDADDLAQIMTLLIRRGRSTDVCDEPLRVLLEECAHDDGSYETWIIPRDRDAEQSLQAEWVAKAWGSGADNEVVANVLHALRLRDAERYADELARGEAFLIKRQSPDGSWSSSWYEGPFYGTYAALRVVREEHAVARAVRFLRNSQEEDGGWATPLSTALALCALSSANALTMPVLERAFAYLQRTREPDGAWPATPFIRMNLGRATGVIHQVLTYGSRCVTAAFVLKAAVGAVGGS